MSSSLITPSTQFTDNMKIISEILEKSSTESEGLTININIDQAHENAHAPSTEPVPETEPLTELSDLDKSKVTLCLNMIVRNESKIITRLLESVLPIIDTYVICDTGSTDDTPTIIKTFFDSHTIPGEIISEPFKNFGYNRTFALKAARNKATYALLLDADMIFKIEPSFNKQLLTKDAYLIIQKGGGLNYHNTRLIRLDIDAKCVGPTHEYYDLPAGHQNEKLDTIWINDIGDGGSKANKFERDIKLLQEGIKEEPNNGRYYFYLANSYFNTGRNIESIPYYKKRIELGGWVEEIFYSYLNLGHAHMKSGQDGEAIVAWMNGFNHHQSRSETIYEICKYYREKGKNKLAMAFCKLGMDIPYPKNDTLFIHKDVYDTGFDYELSILGYYNNYPDTYKVCTRLMNKSNQSYSNLLSNYKFYCPKLSVDTYLIKKIGGFEIKESMTVCGTTYEMNASNPCIFRVNNKYMINIRFVNYKLNRDGSYTFSASDGKIVTVNKIYELDDELNLKANTITFMPDNNNLRYVGIEDIKPYQDLEKQDLENPARKSSVNTRDLEGVKPSHCIPFMGTCQNPINHKLSCGYGEIDMNDLNKQITYKPVSTPYNRDCEKNWVFYGDYKIVYQWFPLTLGKIVKKTTLNETTPNETTPNETTPSELFFEKEKEIKMPPFFQEVRGSTNGCTFGNEIWFICHVVEYCQPREYYHFFAVFEKDTMEIKRWSNLFKYEGEKIEYSLGLSVEEERIIVSYSKWDSTPTIAVYDKKNVEKGMFQ
jgi:tetratricopeptide (TPR) repeat protein